MITCYVKIILNYIVNISWVDLCSLIIIDIHHKILLHDQL